MSLWTGWERDYWMTGNLVVWDEWYLPVIRLLSLVSRSHSKSYQKVFKLFTLLVTMETIPWLYLTISYKKKGIRVYVTLSQHIFEWNIILTQKKKKWLIENVAVLYFGSLTLCKENSSLYINNQYIKLFKLMLKWLFGPIWLPPDQPHPHDF